MGAGGPETALRELAAAQGRAADRITLLRLRLARVLSSAAATGPEGGRLQADWLHRVYPRLGELSRALRVSQEDLRRHADRLERGRGRRLGGYAGAGFLGRGDRAREQVRQVAADGGFRGHSLGASIGGYPLGAARVRPALPHPSEALGVGTPVYEDEDGPSEER
ncbi:hypothetical protein [Brachybacterium hainanense]|uniref:Uncharacterized protein n=1 Tax=Brachybacterium hainanense TaxID=1541174 RepID=A0ABV6RFT2_9MICO